MIITRHNTFKKNFKKRILPYPKLNKQFISKLRLFIQNPDNPVLHNHKLTGSMKGLMSFSVNGDVRIIYRLNGNTVELYDIGTHNQDY